MSKKIVYIDMDCVLVDFYSHPTLTVARTSYNDPQIYKEGFFRNLKPTSYAIAAVEMLNEDPRLDIHILTHGLSGSAYCYQEKVEWIREYLPDLINKIIITCDKTLNKGDVLIDDDIKWNGFEGNFVEFTPYNLLNLKLDVEFTEEVYKDMWAKVIETINKEVK